MAVIGPHVALPDFVRRRKMHGVGGTNEEIAGSGNHRRAGPPQQGFVDWNEVPQPVLDMPGKARGQIARITGRGGALAQAAMKYGMEFSEGS